MIEILLLLVMMTFSMENRKPYPSIVGYVAGAVIMILFTVLFNRHTDPVNIFYLLILNTYFLWDASYSIGKTAKLLMCEKRRIAHIILKILTYVSLLFLVILAVQKGF